MIIVVPPASAAAVPLKKSSLATVPMNGSSMCVCGSMPPGMTYCPPASITRAPLGTSSFSPTALIEPSAQYTSARKLWSAVTTVPPRMSMDMAQISFASRGADSDIDQRSVSLGAPITEELPQVAHLAHHVHVHLGADQFVLVGRSLGQDLAAWVDEIAGAVELTDVPRRLAPHPVHRADVAAV